MISMYEALGHYQHSDEYDTDTQSRILQKQGGNLTGIYLSQK